MYHINTLMSLDGDVIYVFAALLTSVVLSYIQHSVTVVKYCSYYIKLQLVFCMMLKSRDEGNVLRHVKWKGDCPRETILGKYPGKCLDPARLCITQSSTIILVIIINNIINN